MDLFYKGDKIHILITAGEEGETSKVGLDFGQIGYKESDVPQLWKDGMEYAKEIQENWDPEVTTLSRKFEGDKNLVFFPMVETGMVTNMESCFQNCSSLTIIPDLNTEKVKKLDYCFDGCSSLAIVPPMNTEKVTSMYYSFRNCSALGSIPLLNTGNMDVMYSTFSGCKSLTSIPELNMEKVSDMRYCFQDCNSLTTVSDLNTEVVIQVSSCFSNCSKLKRIEGFSFKNMPSISSYSGFFFGYSANTSCSYMLLKDIGTKEACTTLDFTYARAWGIADTDNPDARQSLVNSLLAYSFDRKAAGYSNCTIKLYSTVKALLTQGEIDAIQAKGYIIS